MNCIFYWSCMHREGEGDKLVSESGLVSIIPLSRLVRLAESNADKLSLDFINS
ncbi:hypothetical protein Scep_007293 [Stephania cephalantha]|uniref:Uncharacterized protein n=1 Tax=Stephania cephalantha TaxID=152367 RepID=A0AAP0K9K1_9MAGN